MRYKSARPVRRPEYWMVVVSLAIVSVCFYGIRAAAVYGLAAVTAVLTDFVCLFLRGRHYRLVDLSNVGTALVLVMLFPATIPYSVVILSTVFAVAVGTHVFGYRKDHLFPPAAAGYLFALLCWKDEVLQFPAVGTHLALFGNQVTLHDSLSHSINTGGVLRTELLDLLIGAVCTPMGTGCILLLAVGLLVLLMRRQLSLWAVLGYYLGLALGLHFTGMTLTQLLAGNMVLFSAVFLVADPAVMPCRSLMAYLATVTTGVLVCVLIAGFHIEYAPVVAVMLTCPVWRACGALEQKILGTKAPEVADEQA